MYHLQTCQLYQVLLVTKGYDILDRTTAITTELAIHFCSKFYFKEAHICVMPLQCLVATQTYTTEEMHFKQISYDYG